VAATVNGQWITAQRRTRRGHAQEFVDYALRHAANTDRLVLDLTGVDFFVPRAFLPCTP